MFAKRQNVNYILNYLIRNVLNGLLITDLFAVRLELCGHQATEFQTIHLGFLICL